MRGLLIIALAFIAACTAAEPLAGDVGDEEGSTTSHQSAGCATSRDEILANAGGARAEAISRGFAWFDAQVPYSQGASHEGYRTDCSGFVSMCWGLPQSFTTADFAAGTAANEILPSYEELQPGDGLVRRQGGAGHAVLFLGWNDDSHSSACVLEEASTASDMQFGTRPVSSLQSQGFKAMRADDMPEAAPTVAAEEEPTEEVDVTPAPQATVTAPKLGDACGDDDETCSPNLSGTGLICGAKNKCITGCKIDLGCPGTLLCREGQCK